jgi:hypothetical protein
MLTPYPEICAVSGVKVLFQLSCVSSWNPELNPNNAQGYPQEINGLKRHPVLSFCAARSCWRMKTNQST